MTTIHHMVLCDHGRFGVSFCEMEPATSLRAVADMIASDDTKVVQVIECIIGETCRDVTGDVAAALYARDWDELSETARDLCLRFGHTAPEPDEYADPAESDPNYEYGTLGNYACRRKHVAGFFD